MTNTSNGSASVAGSVSKPKNKWGLPIACFVHAVLGAGCILFLAGPLIGDSSYDPASHLLGHFSGLTDLTVAVPGVILWCAVWAICSWCVGARIWTLIISLSSIGWLMVLRGHYADWTLAYSLIGVLGVGAAGAGYTANRHTIQAGQMDETVRVGGRMAVMLTACMGLFGIVVLCVSWASPDFGIAAMTLGGLFFFVACTATAISLPIGRQFAVAWTANRARRSSLVLIAVLIPCAVLVPAVSGVMSAAEKMTAFQRDTYVQFVSYLDKQLAPSGPRFLETIKLVGPERVHLSWAWDRDAQITSRMEASVPLNWAERQGMRAVDIEWLVYSVHDEPPLGWEKAFKGRHSWAVRETTKAQTVQYRVLRNRRLVDRLLTDLHANPELKKADWHMKPGSERKGYEFRGPAWTATCTIGGAEFTPSVQYESLTIKPKPRGWVPPGY